MHTTFIPPQVEFCQKDNLVPGSLDETTANKQQTESRTCEFRKVNLRFWESSKEEANLGDTDGGCAKLKALACFCFYSRLKVKLIGKTESLLCSFQAADCTQN